MTPADEKLIEKVLAIADKYQEAREAFSKDNSFANAATLNGAVNTIHCYHEEMASIIRTQQARIAELEGEKAALTEKLEVAALAIKTAIHEWGYGDSALGLCGQKMADVLEQALQRISREG